MNSKMVLAALGPAQSKVRELVPGSTDRHYEEWIYGQAPQTVRFVRFEHDRVTQLRIAALGKPIDTHDKNELRGYLDGDNPDTTREIALGDGEADKGSSGPPTILKPGEVAPGSSQRVRLPVSLPDTPPGAPTDKTTPAPAASTPANKSAGDPATPSPNTEPGIHRWRPAGRWIRPPLPQVRPPRPQIRQQRRRRTSLRPTRRPICQPHQRTRVCCINAIKPPRNFPQGLKPLILLAVFGTTEVVPFQTLLCNQNPYTERGLLVVCR